MPNTIGLTVLIVLSVVLVWSGVRARRIGNRAARITSMVALAIASVCALSSSVLAIAGMIKATSRSAPVPHLRIEGSREQILRGEALADSFCGACHSKFGPLTGGMDVGKELAVPVGSFVSSNLTPVGVLSHWTDGEIFRAIRNSVDADGNWLTIMSYTNAGRLSDADIESLIAYIRSRPVAGARTPNPPDHFNLLGLMMLGAGMLPSGSPVFTGVISAPHKSPTAQYGEYILSYQDCRACHGADLSGGVPGQIAPLGPGLQLVKNWQLREFIATLRTGRDPAGRQLGELMPWQVLGRMDDEELTAIYEYLTRSFRNSQMIPERAIANGRK
jgi:mono/diheme cytochrome c family protein